MLALSAFFACGPDEPVVSGVKPPPTVAEIQARREAEQLRTSPRAIEVGYGRPPGVYIDMQFFGGRVYDNVRAEIEAQFGPTREDEELAPSRRRLRFERGTVEVEDGTITRVEVPLPEPVRRSEALTQLGFPAGVGDRWVELTFEFRLNNVKGYRRLIFRRSERGGELVDRVTAMRGERE